MPISFSAMRKKLEQDNICDSLKGHIRYFATRYRESHDAESRVAILFDDAEIFKSSYFDWSSAISKRMQMQTDAESLEERWKQLCNAAAEDGCFDQYEFYDAFYVYDNQSVEHSLASDNPLVRLFAVWDRRTGKRRLLQLKDSIAQEPEWLRELMLLRLYAENIKL